MSHAVQEQLSVAEFERRYLGKRAELWRGEVREYMPTGARHGQTTARITVRLGAYLMGADEGELLAVETGFVIRTPAGESVLAPDLAFIRKERLPEGGLPSGFCPIVPDLVVEVVSPHDTARAVHEKAREWLAGGVQVVWVVDPQQRTVTVWDSHGQAQTLTERDTLYGAPGLPNLQIPVRELFG
jgi:Uma2 family endonuclease